MTSISKSVYIDKLGDLVDEFNNTTEPLKLTLGINSQAHTMNSIKKIIRNIPNLK